MSFEKKLLKIVTFLGLNNLYLKKNNEKHMYISVYTDKYIRIFPNQS